MDVFGPGRHTLTTANLPVLEGFLKNLTGGKNMFQAEVYFVSQKVFQDLKWGTPQPIDLTDPDLGWVSLRAFGSFSIRIQDPQLFLNTLVGTQGYYDTNQLNQFLKGSIRTKLNDLLATNFTSYAKIRRDFEELAAAMKFKVKEDFGKYGIELRDFFIQDVSVPPEVQEAFKERAKMGALGDLGKYTQYQAAQAMRDMANNPGSGGGAMNMGAGLGMGMMMPQLIQQGMQGQPMNVGGQQAPAQGAVPPAAAAGAAAGGAAAAAVPAAATEECPSCKSAVPQGAKFCMSCGGKMQAECASCKAPLGPGAKFCMNCGTKTAE
jgi:membrane protease subunit (stomatin/prohibitin family)